MNNNTKQPPWKIIKTDKEIMLQILESEALKLRDKDLSSVKRSIGNYEYFKKTLAKNGKYQKALEDNCNKQKYYSCEAIIKLFPDKYKEKEHIKFIDLCLKKLYVSGHCYGDISLVQAMLVYHPIREIKMTGLEILVSQGIGDGSADDLKYKLCSMTNCRFIFTEYYSAQEYNGYRQTDPYCPSHGDIIYDDKSRRQLREKWDEIIK